MQISGALLAGVFLVSGGLAMAQDTPAVTAAGRLACGPDEVKFDAKQAEGNAGPAEMPQNGKALVFLLTTQGSCPGCEATLRYGVDGSWVGATKGTSRIALQMSPGDHHLCVNWQARMDMLSANVELLPLRVESGKVYFLRTRVLYSPSLAQLIFEPAEADEGALLVKTSPKADWKKK